MSGVSAETVFLRQCWRLAAALLCALLLTGCQEKPLKLGIHPWIGYDVIPMAQQWNWLGPEIELIETASGAGSLAALARGELHAACLTLDEVIRGLDEGLPLSIIVVMDISSGAVDTGTIDQPVTRAPRSSGGATLLSRRDTPGLSFDVIAVHRDAVAGRQKTLRQLISAVLRAQEHVHDNPVDALYRLASLHERPVSATEEELRRIVVPTRDAQYSYFERDSSLRAAARRINELFVDARIIDRPQGDTGLLDSSFLPDPAS